MRNYLRKIFIASFCGVFSVGGFSSIFSQQSKPTGESSGESGNQPKLGCSASAKNTGEKMTYSVGAGKLSAEDSRRMTKDYGVLTIPKGETKLAREIRKAALKRTAEQISTLENGIKIWIKEHPNATAEETEEALSLHRAIINRIKNKTDVALRAALPRWDWRENGVSVGPVLNQGLKCNTCWAFTAIDAVTASFHKSVSDEYNYNYHSLADGGSLSISISAPRLFIEESRPSVQELLNCMPIPAEKICQTGWHGKAFKFFVNQMGVPIEKLPMRITRDENGVVTKTPSPQPPIYAAGKKFECFPVMGFIKAYSWDYVNSPPDKLPTVKQLKTALVEHGPLAAPIVYDDCLGKYQGGIFNEKDMGTVNHVVLLIGWDDAKKAWLVKNSWGEKWGEKGFAWIRYGSNNIGVFAAWIDAGPAGSSLFSM